MANARPIVDVSSEGAGRDMVSRRRPSRFIERGRRRREAPREAARAVEWNAPRQIQRHAIRHDQRVRSTLFSQSASSRRVRPTARQVVVELFPATHVTPRIIRDARRRPQAARRSHVVERRRPLPRDASGRVAAGRVAAGRAFASLSRAPPRARRGPRLDDASDASEAVVSSVSSDASAASSPRPLRTRARLASW